MTPLNSLAEAAQKLYDGGHVALADEMLFFAPAHANPASAPRGRAFVA